MSSSSVENCSDTKKIKKSQNANVLVVGRKLVWHEKKKPPLWHKLSKVSALVNLPWGFLIKLLSVHLILTNPSLSFFFVIPTIFHPSSSCHSGLVLYYKLYNQTLLINIRFFFRQSKPKISAFFFDKISALTFANLNPSASR